MAGASGPAVHPGEILLEEFLKPLGMTQAAAQRLGMSTVRVNELVRGMNGASVRQRARSHGIAGIYGNRGIVESVTYRF